MHHSQGLFVVPEGWDKLVSTQLLISLRSRGTSEVALSQVNKPR